MAKKMLATKRKAARAPKAKRATKEVQPYSFATDRVSRHVAMIMDPCNSILGPTAYRGRDGFINRFSAAVDTSNTTQTCGIVAFWPRYNRYFVAPLLTETTTFSLNFWDVSNSFAGPGGAYLGANAAETRVIGACIQTMYTGTELDRQGYLVQGVLGVQSTTGTVSILALKQACQRFSRTQSDEPLETKWVPAPDNESYQRGPTSTPGLGTDSDNIIVHIYCGFAANKANFTHRITHITEWLPNSGLGITVPAPASPDPPAGLERVRSNLTQFGHWWVEAMHTAQTAYRVGRSVARGVSAVASAAAPLLLAA